RLSRRAEVVVRETYTYPGARSFQVLSETGSEVIRDRVIRRLLQAETEASSGPNSQESQVTPENYEFRLRGTQNVEGRPAYVLEITPRREDQYLMRGRIWVDDADAAIVRMEGEPAERPSFWTRSTHF